MEKVTSSGAQGRNRIVKLHRRFSEVVEYLALVAAVNCFVEISWVLGMEGG